MDVILTRTSPYRGVAPYRKVRSWNAATCQIPEIDFIPRRDALRWDEWGDQAFRIPLLDEAQHLWIANESFFPFV
jgi:hypothetical protein